MESLFDSVVSGLGKSISSSSFLVSFALHLSYPCLTSPNSLDNISFPPPRRPFLALFS